MNQEWLDCLMMLPMNRYDLFQKNTILDMQLEASQKFFPIDYSWLKVIERYLPILKKVIESPYSLLSMEELKKHYESRFLYTLLCRLEEFLRYQYERFLEQEIASGESTLKLHGQTTLEEEDIELQLAITVKKKEGKKENSKLTTKERLERAILFLKPLRQSDFVNRMEGASFVKSPIRRSVLQAQNEDYRKLLEVFDFLENYAILEKAFSKKKRERKKEDFLIPYFMNACFLLESNTLKETNLDFLKKYLEGFVRQFVEESSIDEKDFKKMMNKLFEEEYSKKKSREKNIHQIFTKSFDNHQKQVKDALRILRN